MYQEWRSCMLVPRTWKAFKKEKSRQTLLAFWKLTTATAAEWRRTTTTTWTSSLSKMEASNAALTLTRTAARGWPRSLKPGGDKARRDATHTAAQRRAKHHQSSSHQNLSSFGPLVRVENFRGRSLARRDLLASAAAQPAVSLTELKSRSCLKKSYVDKVALTYT